MPLFDSKKIKKLITQNMFYGITLDTCIFDKYGCNLEFSVFRALEQFKKSSVKVLISEIVKNEIIGHITRDAKSTKLLLNRGIKKQIKRWKLNVDMKNIDEKLKLTGNENVAAKQQFTTFISAVNAKIVPAAGTMNSTNELLKRYYASEPPFDFNEKNKYEFPDAFALLSLERCKDAQEKYILCVSEDNGWQKFCDSSDRLVCVKKLTDALSYFNESGHTTVNRVIRMLQTGAPEFEDFRQSIREMLEYNLDLLQYTPSGTSALPFDILSDFLMIKKIDFDSAVDPTIIEVNQKTVTFTVIIDVHVSFFASFYFYSIDSVDNENRSPDSSFRYKDEIIKVLLVITTLKGKETDNKIVDILISTEMKEINFGYVEPNVVASPTPNGS